MSISLAEASKLSTDILLKGIIETIVKDSPILQELPFIQIVGNSLKYNREKNSAHCRLVRPGDRHLDAVRAGFRAVLCQPLRPWRRRRRGQLPQGYQE